MKKYLLLVLILSMFAACDPYKSDTAGKITIVYSNGTGSDSGMMASRYTAVESIRAESGDGFVLLLDTGNIFGKDGKLDSRLYAALGYDAVVLGKKDFEMEASELAKRIILAPFPVLTTNLSDADGNTPGFRWITTSRGNLKIGIFGVTDSGLSVEGFTLLPEIPSAKDAVKHLRNNEKCDIVIALTHLNNPGNLAKKVSGIDFIINGAPSGAEPQNISGIKIIHAPERPEMLGKITYNRLSSKKEDVSYELTDISKINPDTILWSMVQTFGRPAWEEVVAIAPEGFLPNNRLPRSEETAAGNFITDAMYWFTTVALDKKIDFAMMTAGSVYNIKGDNPIGFTRTGTGLETGSTDLGSVMRRLGENELILTMKGADLLEVIKQAGSNWKAGGFGVYSSQLRVVFNETEKEKLELISAELNGKTIDPGGIYRFTLNAYAAGGKDDFYNVLNDKVIGQETVLPMSIAVNAYAAYLVRVQPVLDGRMVINPIAAPTE